MKAPLTKAALQNAGVKFRMVREETAAGHIDRQGFTLSGTDDHKAMLTWILSHCPDKWDDAAVAERLRAITAELAPQLPAIRAALDRPGYQALLRAATDKLFG